MKVTLENYQELAVRTENADMDAILARLVGAGPSLIRFHQPNRYLIRILHAVIGMQSELGELSEAVRRQDAVNIMEEVGDFCWYLALACDAMYRHAGEMRGTLTDLLTIAGSRRNPDFDKAVEEISIMADMVKKSLFYGKEWQLERMRGRLAEVADAVIPYRGTYTLEEVLERNIQKLAVRFPKAFTDVNAVNRDLNKERKTLEGKDPWPVDESVTPL